MQLPVFALGTLAYSRRHQQSLNIEEAWCFLPVLLAFYAVEYYFLNRITPLFAPYISLLFALGLVLLGQLSRRYVTDRQGSTMLIESFATLAAFHSFYLQILPDNLRGWLLVPIVMGAALSPVGIISRASLPRPLPALALIAIAGIEYLSLLGQLINPSNDFRSPVSTPLVVLLGLAVCAAGWLLITRRRSLNWVETIILPATHVLALATLYRLTESVGELAISAGWLFYGAWVMLYGFRSQDRPIAKSALFILGLSAAKVLLYDISGAPSIMRILCLLLTGAVLYGCGILMRRINAWDAPSAAIPE